MDYSVTCTDPPPPHSGVADGVGGWKREGIDSSHFSAALMSSCANVVNEQRVDLDRPVDILTRAMRETVWLNSRIYGKFITCSRPGAFQYI